MESGSNQPQRPPFGYEYLDHTVSTNLFDAFVIKFN